MVLFKKCQAFTIFTFVDQGASIQAFDLGDIGLGESVTTTYDVEIGNDVETGTYTNTATAEADNHDPVSADENVDVEAPIVLGETTEAELDITKTADVEYTNPDSTVVYTVVVTNNGTEDAQNVVLVDQLPEGFVFEGTTDQVKSWEFTTITMGSSETVTYNATVNSNTTEGMYDNVAVVNADNADENNASETVEVRNVAVLGELVDTGTTFRDYLLYFLGISLVVTGIWFSTREKRLARSK